MDKRNQVNIETAIVSIELQPEGKYILIAYAGNCVIVAVPQRIPDDLEVQTSTDATVSKIEDKILPLATEESNSNVAKNQKEMTEMNGDYEDKVKTLDRDVKSVSIKSKETIERRATLNLKALTRSFKTIESNKIEVSF